MSAAGEKFLKIDSSNIRKQRKVARHRRIILKYGTFQILDFQILENPHPPLLLRPQKYNPPLFTFSMGGSSYDIQLHYTIIAPHACNMPRV